MRGIARFTVAALTALIGPLVNLLHRPAGTERPAPAVAPPAVPHAPEPESLPAADARAVDGSEAGQRPPVPVTATMTGNWESLQGVEATAKIPVDG